MPRRKTTKKETASRAKQFDTIVIGAGAAGFSAAEVLAANGMDVCVVEKGRLGGECPNWACVPTKSLLKSAKTYYDTKHKLGDLGVRATNVGFSFSRIMKRKDAVVNAVTGNGKKLYKVADELGITIVKGTARFLDAHTVEVAGEKYKGDFIVLATGAVPFIPPIAGINEIDVLTYKDVVSLKRQPGSVAIIGGGPVACEFATFFSYLGTRVHLLELTPHLLGREENEISDITEKNLAARGVQVHTRTKTLSVKKEGRRYRVTYQTGQGPRKYSIVDNVILAVGTRADIDSLQLKKAKVKVDQKGRLVMKETMQTSVAHIYAAGDVSGGMKFTHTAHHEGYVVAANILKKPKRGLMKRDDRVVPRVTFVDPEVASVGLTEGQARQRRKPAKSVTFAVGALGRAVTEGDRRGIVKLVFDSKTRKILGGHMAGPHAGEVIHEVALAMQLHAKIDDIADMMHAFPTFSESLVAAASKA